MLLPPETCMNMINPLAVKLGRISSIILKGVGSWIQPGHRLSRVRFLIGPFEGFEQGDIWGGALSFIEVNECSSTLHNRLTWVRRMCNLWTWQVLSQRPISPHYIYDVLGLLITWVFSHIPCVSIFFLYDREIEIKILMEKDSKYNQRVDWNNRIYTKEDCFLSL